MSITRGQWEKPSAETVKSRVVLLQANRRLFFMGLNDHNFVIEKRWQKHIVHPPSVAAMLLLESGLKKLHSLSALYQLNVITKSHPCFQKSKIVITALLHYDVSVILLQNGICI